MLFLWFVNLGLPSRQPPWMCSNTLKYHLSLYSLSVTCKYQTITLNIVKKVKKVFNFLICSWSDYGSIKKFLMFTELLICRSDQWSSTRSIKYLKYPILKSAMNLGSETLLIAIQSDTMLIDTTFMLLFVRTQTFSISIKNQQSTNILGD